MKNALMAWIALIALAGTSAVASEEKDALKAYEKGMKRIVEEQEDYCAEQLETELRAATDKLVRPWMGMRDPEGAPYWFYDLSGFSAIFETWTGYEVQKGLLAASLARIDGEAVARELFDTLRKTAAQIADWNEELRESKARFFIWLHHQEPAIRLHGAHAHRDALVQALGSLRDEEAIAYLVTSAWKKARSCDRKARSVLLRVALLDALALSGSPTALSLLDEAVASKEPQLRIAALEGLASSAASDRDLLRTWLLDVVRDDPCYAVRATALELLRTKLADPRIVPSLAGALVLPRREIERSDIERTLHAIVGQDLGETVAPWRSWYESHRGAIEARTWKRTEPEQQPTVARSATDGSAFFGIRSKGRHVVVIVKAGKESNCIPADVRTASAKNLRHWEAWRLREQAYTTLWELARSELTAWVARRPKGTTYNVMLLHGPSKMTTLGPKMVRAGRTSAKRALKVVNDHTPGGWAPVLPAIWQAYGLSGADPWGTRIPDEPLVDAIYLVGGFASAIGPIQTTPAILADLRRRHRFLRLPIHCVRTGPFEVAGELMAGIAEVTGGTFTFRKKP